MCVTWKLRPESWGTSVKTFVSGLWAAPEDGKAIWTVSRCGIRTSWTFMSGGHVGVHGGADWARPCRPDASTAATPSAPASAGIASFFHERVTMVVLLLARASRCEDPFPGAVAHIECRLSNHRSGW